MSICDRWKVVLILLTFMQEADDKTLLDVAEYAANKMVAGEQNDEKELAAVWDALAETVAESSDQEILAQVREQGLDPHDEAVRVRMLLRDALKSRQQAKLPPIQRKWCRDVLKLVSEATDEPTERAKP